MTAKDLSRFALLLPLALALPLAASRDAAGADPLLHLTAFSINLNNGARTNTVDIVIERWSTPEEIDQLRGILIEKGGKDLLPALQKIKPRCGYVRTTNTLGWDAQFARETQLEDGTRRIVIATDRPISFWEARNNPRSRDYEFTLAEIRLPKEGKGEGKLISAAKLTYDKEKKTLEIENYQREPVRLNEIRLVK
jgi:hypothetical protein